MSDNILRRVKRMDEERPNIPGEHWVVFATGVGLWLATRRHPSMVVRLVGGIAGSLLVVHAASGRDVPEAMARWLPFEDRHRRAPGLGYD